MNAKQYQQVTDRIVAMLEAGTRPWQKSWKTSDTLQPSDFVWQRPLRSNGKPYTGVNVMNLWAAAHVRGFTSPYWFTFKGALEVGGNVKKGARAELAFYVGRHTVTEQPAGGGDATEKSISFLRCYHVFNADECENLPERYRAATAPAAPVIADDGRMATVDAFVAALGVPYRHGGDRAYYIPSRDAVQMPHLAQFNAPASYYATLLHEMTHATGHTSRCDRQFGAKFGDDSHAFEELVAELGAAFLCADLAISDEPRADHADYIASWLRVLKGDPRAIFKAASLAEKAASWCHGRQSAGEAPEEFEAPELAMAA